MPESICEHHSCDNAVPSRPRQRFCSRSCKENARKARRAQSIPRHIVACQWCDSPLPTDAPKQTRYCQDGGCAWAAQRLAMAAWFDEQRGCSGQLDLRYGYIPDGARSPDLRSGPRRDYLNALRRDPCAHCGAEGRVIDHIVPRVQGGANDVTNLTGICETCNLGKKDRPLLYHMLVARMRPQIEALAEEMGAITGIKYLPWFRGSGQRDG